MKQSFADEVDVDSDASQAHHSPDENAHMRQQPSHEGRFNPQAR